MTAVVESAEPAEVVRRPSSSTTDRLRALLVQRSEVLVLSGLLLGSLLLPNGFTSGITTIGVVEGCALALQALAIVLVYRSNRLINFAQVQIGATAAVIFTKMADRGSFPMLVHEVCNGCVKVDHLKSYTGKPYTVPVMSHGVYVLNYWLSAATGLLTAVLLSLLLMTLLSLKRLVGAPRLILTVFTVGAGQLFALGGTVVTSLYGGDPVTETTAPLPFTWSTRLGGVRFGPADLLLVLGLVVAAVALTLYLRRSSVGILLRGGAENPTRAQTLGVNTVAVNARAWLIAGGLTGFAALVGATGSGAATGSTAITSVLAAAVVGGLTSLPLAAAAALVFGVVARLSLASYGSTAITDGVAFGVVMLVLLVQRRRSSRADSADQGWAQTVELRPIPAELRRLPVVVSWIRWGRLLAATALLGLPWLLSPSQTNLFVVVLLYACLGLSLLVLTGWAGQMSLGQLAIAGVGAYTAAISGLPFPLSLLAAGCVGAVTALIIGLPALRLRGLHLAVTTLAFSAAVVSLLLNSTELGSYLPHYLGRPDLLGLKLSDERVFYYAVVLLLAVFLVATVGLRRSRSGRALIACRENESAAQAFGINLVRLRLSAFMISGFMAAVAGGMAAYASYGVHSSDFGVGQGIYVFVLVVIGGLGSIMGPLLGALYVGATTVFTSNDIVGLASTGFGLVAVLLFAPGGLSQVVYTVRDAGLRRIADRYKIDVPSLFENRASARDVQAPIAPKQRPGGGTIFVPERFRAEGQWAVEMLRRQR